MNMPRLPSMVNPKFIIADAAPMFSFCALSNISAVYSRIYVDITANGM